MKIAAAHRFGVRHGFLFDQVAIYGNVFFIFWQKSIETTLEIIYLVLSQIFQKN